jgi:hypothetical protein
MVVLVIVSSLNLSPGVAFPYSELEKEEVAVVPLGFADSAAVAVVPPVSVESG